LHGLNFEKFLSEIRIIRVPFFLSPPAAKNNNRIQ